MERLVQGLFLAIAASVLFGGLQAIPVAAEDSNPAPATAPTPATPPVRPMKNNRARLPRACKQIADACRKAGFIRGDWKKGDGLWRDCVDPIVQGAATVPGATKPLPVVDPQVVAACKAHRPKFGEGKVGSQPSMTPPPQPQ